ncbi:GNAT family N-acetyltransferase [Geodermatophilus sabuli]|uniref:Amino-acid N-acetyltransferase n=1 Tax=Geodermatophilus sabuli TaxID=1564158 RepID=A0A285EAC1_9ACTN|nr:GNAT family N-acetyltransferase [Geodermatophilus sabuli]MBB3084779.1 amino-acid N-acetyltransferase [Geodermatophilus sabuli]SNX95813.1 amino-acid N-acetyltransferase [Geodermatophilus sabuli]
MITTPREVPPALVRKATPADLAVISDLLAAAGLPLAGLHNAAHVLVADAAGTLAGTVALERHGSGDATAFLLRSVAVAPAWRGRGVGATLTAAALALVDDVGAPVGLLTETAAGYFPRFGFTPVDRDQLPAALSASAELRGACPASAHALLRPVTDATEGR